MRHEYFHPDQAHVEENVRLMPVALAASRRNGRHSVHLSDMLLIGIAVLALFSAAIANLG